MPPYKVDKIDPMVKLVKHDEASKVFDIDLFYTTGDMRFYMADEKDIVSVYVPRGFLTDGASVPKTLQIMFPVWDTYYQAAVFHDYLCEYLTIYVNDTPKKISRTEADKIFDRIMKHLNVATVKRKIVAAGVIAFSHMRSIIYPSATATKRLYEDKIREQLAMIDKARADQKKKYV